MAPKRLIVLRHEPTQENLSGIIQGQSIGGTLVNQAISPEKAGWCQQRIIPPACILTSSATRAIKSAEELGKILKIPVHSLPLLQQRGWGNIEGKTLYDIHKDFVRNAFSADIDVLAPGAESLKSVRARACNTWLYIKGLSVATVILVTHDEFSNYLINEILSEGLFKHPLQFNEAHIIEFLPSTMISKSVLHATISHSSPTYRVLVRRDASGFLSDELGIRILRNRGIEILIESRQYHPEEIDGIIIGDQLFTNIDLARYPRLKVIARFGKGIDNVQITPRENLWITNTPGCNERAVAEFTISLILNLITNLSFGKSINEHLWTTSLRTEWSNITIGIVGLGTIGKLVVQIAKMLGFQVIVWTKDPEQNQSFVATHNLHLSISLEELCAQIDVLSLHLSLNEETKEIINQRHFELMKNRHAYLVNTARAGIIDYLALKSALENGYIKAAAIDVWPEEPLKSPWLLELANNERVIATPHCAGKTAEALKKQLLFAHIM